jgi:hypothetical protein
MTSLGPAAIAKLRRLLGISIKLLPSRSGFRQDAGSVHATINRAGLNRLDVGGRQNDQELDLFANGELPPGSISLGAKSHLQIP